MWLDNLKELKKKAGMTSQQIALATNLPERTVVRIFSGDTDAPRVDTLRRVVAVLGGSLDDLFAESGSVVANTDMVALQAAYDAVCSERDHLQAQAAMLDDRIKNLTTENELLRLKLSHQEELLAVHNHYNKIKRPNG